MGVSASSIFPKGSQQHGELGVVAVTGSWGSQQHQNLGVSTAPKSEAAEESGGLSSTRMWGSQQQKNMGVSAAEEYGTGGLSSTRIWGYQQHQKGVSRISIVWHWAHTTFLTHPNKKGPFSN